MKFKLLVILYLLKYRWRGYPKTRPELEAWQEEKIKEFLVVIIQKSKYYADKVHKYGSWKNFPFLNKKIMMDNFDTLNTVGISRDNALKIAIDSENSRDFSPTIGDITVGLSSGTSGNRGLFIASGEERAKWVAYVIAKVLWPLNKKKKIAFFLRANNQLYSSVKSNKLEFNFFDLKDDIKANMEKLNAYQPEIIVAQPSMLRIIANALENNVIQVNPEKVLSVAEVLEKTDKEYLEKVFKQTIHQAYQCTEGFLAVSCNYGVLHFNEDIVRIDKEYIDAERTRFFPVITDFTRSSQPIIRYKLNDIIVEKKERCQCGSVFTAIDHIEGRSDDIFYFKNNNNQMVSIFPDFFRKAVITASEEIEEYVVEEIELNNLNIYLKVKENRYEVVKELVRSSINHLLKEYGIDSCHYSFSTEIPVLGDKKLQRIKRRFKINE
jgi:putative adenylate-forming enzyme